MCKENKNYEYLNSEYQNIHESVEYKLGRKFLDIKKELAANHFFAAFRKLVITFKSKSKKHEDSEIVFVNIPSIIPNKKIAIYTCITGEYDMVQEPLVLEKNCDYFILTDNKNMISDSWKVVDISNVDIKSNILLNRYAKFHPKIFFPEYDYSIYVDGNIQIVSNISGYVSICDNTNTGIALHTHSSRSCVYEELDICKMYKKGNREKLQLFQMKCKAAGLKAHSGLFECGVIATDLNSSNAMNIYQNWWDSFSLFETGRDQVLLPYVLMELNFEAKDIGFMGNNIHRNSKFKFMLHSKDDEKFKIRSD